MPDHLSSRLGSMSIFGSKAKQDPDDQGEAVDAGSVAGGGHAARITQADTNLRVSDALRQFLVHEKIIHDDAAKPNTPLPPQLRALVLRPYSVVPPALQDRSHPLASYFISSSHNTYLLAHQLFGTSNVSAYAATLGAGARCVEIDAWDNEANPEEPKVTHGYTLVSNVPFRAVCETIRDVIDKEKECAVAGGFAPPAPILLSLENHCSAKGQMRLVEIMCEVWGDRLLSRAVREKGHQEEVGGDPVRLAELGSKIVVIVEYHMGGEPVDDADEGGAADGESGSSDDAVVADGDSEETQRARQEYAKKKKQAPVAVIIPELAAIGVYAQSVKPPNNSWYESQLINGPHDHLINVSETQLVKLMPQHDGMIAQHNAQHLMRVYPKGTRIASDNLQPVPFWGRGAQICALNWQTFGASMQLNEALFSGSDGYVLKPQYLRGGLELPPDLKRLRVHIVGATDVPIPKGRDADGGDIKPYVSCVLVHPEHLKGKPPKRKTDGYKQHKHTAFLRKDHTSPPTDPVWDETLEWEYNDNELVFLRLLLKSDDKFAANPTLATAAVRLSYVAKGFYGFIRMLDLRGHETNCTLLIKIDVSEEDGGGEVI